MTEKHTFALFYKGLQNVLEKGKQGFIELSDKDVLHRITKILRIETGGLITLFDNSINLEIEVAESTKNRLVCKILRSESNKQILPEVILMPCILRKEAFEEVVYTAAQMAVTKIVPVLSTKVQRSWGNEKEIERLTKIMISGCEQSKNFIVPMLCDPVKIQGISKYFESDQGQVKAYFDPSGQNFINLLHEIKQFPNLTAVLLFGPEGGLTIEEEKTITALGFKTYALTPTILRSREAVLVGLGGIRSVVS